MNRLFAPSIVALLALALTSPGAHACAMYIPPSEKVVVEAAPVAPQHTAVNAINAPIQPIPAPAPTDLQRAMALIDEVAMLPAASLAPRPSPAGDAMAPTGAAPMRGVEPIPASAPPMTIPELGR